MRYVSLLLFAVAARAALIDVSADTYDACPSVTTTTISSVTVQSCDNVQDSPFALAVVEFSDSAWRVYAEAKQGRDSEEFKNAGANANFTEVYVALGGQGGGIASLSFENFCGGGSNNAFVSQPYVAIDNGTVRAENQQLGQMVECPGPAGHPGVLNVPFVFGDQLTIYLYSGPMGTGAFDAHSIHESIASIRLLDLNGDEIDGASLAPIPEPSSALLLSVGLLIGLARRRCLKGRHVSAGTPWPHRHLSKVVAVAAETGAVAWSAR